MRIFRTALVLQLVASAAAFSSWPSSQPLPPRTLRNSARSVAYPLRRRLTVRRASPQLKATAGEWQSLIDDSTGQQYYWNVQTGETAWTLPSDDAQDSAAAPWLAGGTGSELPIKFTGEGTRTKVVYQQILRGAVDSVQAARAAGKRRLQIEFPLDDKDEGKTLVKRFELMSTFAEEFAAAFGLPRVQRVGEDIEIRDNVTPGGSVRIMMPWPDADKKCRVGLQESKNRNDRSFA